MKAIELRLDTTSDPDRETWIVSRVRLGDDDGSETTDTVACIDGDAAYVCAKAIAIQMAEREGIRANLRLGSGAARPLYVPKRFR